MKKLKLGQILIGTNLRNTKNIEITCAERTASPPFRRTVNERRHTFKERMILKTRIKIEHTTLRNEYKKFKRLNIRNDKYINNYKNYMFLPAIIIIIRKTNL